MDGFQFSIASDLLLCLCMSQGPEGIPGLPGFPVSTSLVSSLEVSVPSPCKTKVSVYVVPSCHEARILLFFSFLLFVFGGSHTC